MVKRHLSGGGYEWKQDSQWLAPVVVRARGDRAGPIQGRVERWPRYGGFEWWSKEAAAGWGGVGGSLG